MDNILSTADDAENLSASFVTRVLDFEKQVDECEVKAVERAAATEHIVPTACRCHDGAASDAPSRTDHWFDSRAMPSARETR